MFNNQQASIAVLGYRNAPEAQADEIVNAIDEILQKTDAQPREVTWMGDSIAMIDRIGMRIGIGLLPPTTGDRYTHLVLAIGGNPASKSSDELLGATSAYLADRLASRIKDDMPYDTIMRGETPEMVDHDLVLSLYDLLRQTPPASSPSAAPNTDKQPTTRAGRKASPAASQDDIDVILAEEVPGFANGMPTWFERRAVPTKPLRLTIHAVALSIMLFSAPLGAFLFTYSMLRDITGNS